MRAARRSAIWRIKLTKLEEKFPELMPEIPGRNRQRPCGKRQAHRAEQQPTFPAFEGKDLDGNPVKSDELFSANAVTVVNFWFTTCKPCVGELGDLEALNKSLAEKGGTVVGINAFTLDGDETAIAEAKAVLAKKGATYRNLHLCLRQRGRTFLPVMCSPSPPPMWLTATAISWVNPS